MYIALKAVEKPDGFKIINPDYNSLDITPELLNIVWNAMVDVIENKIELDKAYSENDFGYHYSYTIAEIAMIISINRACGAPVMTIERNEATRIYNSYRLENNTTLFWGKDLDPEDVKKAFDLESLPGEKVQDKIKIKDVFCSPGMWVMVNPNVDISAYLAGFDRPDLLSAVNFNIQHKDHEPSTPLMLVCLEPERSLIEERVKLKYANLKKSKMFPKNPTQDTFIELLSCNIS